VAPSTALSERPDLVLAALVLFTSLGIQPAQRLGLRRRAAALTALVAVPLVVLAPLALVSLLFSGAVSDGVLCARCLVHRGGGRWSRRDRRRQHGARAGTLTGSLVVAGLAGPSLLGC
jgi:hypothetical protein